MTNYFRIASLLLFGILLNSSIIVHCQTGFILSVQENMKHQSTRFKAVTVRTMTECFQHCLAHCECMSFDLCKINDKNCRMHESNIETDGLMHLTPSDDCNHYEFKQTNNQQCDSSCMSAVNCCLTSNPCNNGGTCLPSTNTKRRYQCACANGFVGQKCGRCQNGYTGSDCQEKITSCRGYANESRVSKTYLIFNSQGQLVNVFCDFDANSTWTLIQSFSLMNVGKFRDWFDDDRPRSENTPSWTSYRLPKSEMQLIQKDSTKWRITCDYEKHEKAVEIDSIRVANSIMDLLSRDSKLGQCVLVEYINVRGYNCSDCTAALYHTHYFPFHFDSLRSLEKPCFFRVYEAKDCGSVGGEDNFGQYTCVNNNHRCSAKGTSTTQTWFGGYK